MDKYFCKRADFTLPDAPHQYPPDLEIEPVHMDLDLTFDLEKKQVEGTNTITIKGNVNNAKSLKLHAEDFDKLNISDDTIDWTYDGSIVDIHLLDPLNENETKEISIDYKVTNPIAGLYFSYPDEEYPNRPIYVGSDHETERARYWIPCLDHPSIRTTFDLHLTAHNDLTILAIGEKVDTSVEDELKTVHWHHDYPCPVYIAAIAIGEFISYQDRSVTIEGKEIPIAYYTTDNYKPEYLKLAFDKTPEMIEWFANKFDHHIPWAKYYQFSLDRIFGAMENQSLVSWSDFAVVNEDNAKEMGKIIDSINVHELAHTYFGDMVVIRDWGHAWLKESWATYVSSLWFEDKVSIEEFNYDLYTNANRYFNEVDNKYVRPIVNRQFHSSWEMYDAHLYPGGAWRLHMLRHQLGEETFFTAVQSYLDKFDGQTVETIDFMRELEEFSGKSLSGFFDQWILQARGYPELTLKFKYNKDDNQGIFTITQSHVDTSNEEPRYKPFEFDLDLMWMLDGEKNIQTITVDSRKHQVTVDMDNKPTYVQMDPNHKILFKTKFDLKEEMLRNMLESEDVFLTINAAKQLVETGKQKNIDAVGKQINQEEFWGVKKELIEALGSSNSRFAIPYLVEVLEDETDPELLHRIPKLVTKIRDKKITNALVEFTKRDDLPPTARASGISALADQHDPDTEEHIRSFLDREGWKYMSRGAAYTALSKSRNKEYLDLLIEKSKYGNSPEKIRTNIITGIGRLAKWHGELEKTKARESLENLLRDELSYIRITAARALVSLGERGAIKKLKQLKGKHPKQTQVAIDKMIKQLRDKAEVPNQISDLKSRLEDAEDKIQKLEEKLMLQEDDN